MFAPAGRHESSSLNQLRPVRSSYFKTSGDQVAIVCVELEISSASSSDMKCTISINIAEEKARRIRVIVANGLPADNLGFALKYREVVLGYLSGSGRR